MSTSLKSLKRKNKSQNQEKLGGPIGPPLSYIHTYLTMNLTVPISPSLIFTVKV